MSNKILVIAEGERAEKNFLNSMKDAFRFNHTFCCLRGNIYLLYQKMREVDFNADVKSILTELHPEYREQLNERFAYTYLIFDMDPHHTKRYDDRPIETVVRDNCRALQEMASKHLQDYAQSDFEQLTKQNVYKLNWMGSRLWDKMPYDSYLTESQQKSILDKQERLIEGDGHVAVLNTSLFLILDYYGNRDGFYDAVMSG